MNALEKNRLLIHFSLKNIKVGFLLVAIQMLVSKLERKFLNWLMWISVSKALTRPNNYSPFSARLMSAPYCLCAFYNSDFRVSCLQIIQNPSSQMDFSSCSCKAVHGVRQEKTDFDPPFWRQENWQSWCQTRVSPSACDVARLNSVM